MSSLLVLVPTRGRPENVRRLAQAWCDTIDVNVATDALFLVDDDDPEIKNYITIPSVRYISYATWQPMVHKLNNAAVSYAASHFALGFMGDDHLPRTRGWNRLILESLQRLGTGIVYGDDLYQGQNLPTHWFMTSDIVSALGKMVPAPVEHLYCDDSILKLGAGARCIEYLPDVQIEHMHYVAGKAKKDAGYRRVNSSVQYRRDRTQFTRWCQNGYDIDMRKVLQIKQLTIKGST